MFLGILIAITATLLVRCAQLQIVDGQVYQVYQMTNAVVESLQTSGSTGGDNKTTEAVSFAYAQLGVTYTFFDGSGKAGGTESMTFTSGSCP